MTETDIHLLLADCATKRLDAFDALYKKVSAQLFGIALCILKREELAEEALQETFLQIWNRAADFDSSKGEAISWMAALCRYRSLDLLRRQAHQPGISLEESNINPIDPNDSRLDHLLTGTQQKKLFECLQELTPEQRKSIALAYFDGLTQLEIAKQLNSPLGTVKSWVRRALQSLKRCLQA